MNRAHPLGELQGWFEFSMQEHELIGDVRGRDSSWSRDGDGQVRSKRSCRPRISRFDEIRECF